MEKIKVYCRLRDVPSSEFEIDETQQRIKINTKSFDIDGFLNDQQHVFTEVAKPLLEDVQNGYSATIFAFGQSGSGKTYTMFGTTENLGLVPNIALTLINSPEALRVQLSFIEIYMDRAYDLLADQPLEMKYRNCPKTIELTNLTVFWDAYREANDRRVVRETKLNEYSTRSHVITRFTVAKKHPNGEKSIAQFHCVDLSGSERLKSSLATGLAKEETGYINSDLSLLRTYVNNVKAMQQSGQQVRMIAGMRDTTLNVLLGKHIGGHIKTRFIITIRPDSIYTLESIDSLRFGLDIRSIKVNPKRVVDSDTLLARYNALLEENKRLKLLVEDYEKRLKSFGTSDAVFEQRPLSFSRSDESVGSYVSVQSSFSSMDRKLQPSDVISLYAPPRRKSVKDVFDIETETETKTETETSQIRQLVNNTLRIVAECGNGFNKLRKRDREIT